MKLGTKDHARQLVKRIARMKVAGYKPYDYGFVTVDDRRITHQQFQELQPKDFTKLLKTNLPHIPQHRYCLIRGYMGIW